MIPLLACLSRRACFVISRGALLDYPRNHGHHGGFSSNAPNARKSEKKNLIALKPCGEKR